MRIWNREYWLYLTDQFKALTRDLKPKLDQVVAGRAVPSAANINIGSARKVDAAVLFFDIKGSSQLPIDEALYALNIVIPTIMRIVHDHDGYIEKNTGDGVMAIFKLPDEKSTAKAALQSAMVMFSALKEVINPHLIQVGFSPINARVGMDFGSIYVSRVGVPRGSAEQDRSFLTAIGPTANVACRLQEKAGTNEIWVGNALMIWAPQDWKQSFRRVYPSEWGWIIAETSDPYPVWHFERILPTPVSASTYLTSLQPSLLPSLFPDLPSPIRTKLEQPPSPYQSLIDALLKKPPGS